MTDMAVAILLGASMTPIALALVVVYRLILIISQRQELWV